MKNRLRVIRAEKKMSQQKLAEMCGVSRTAINGIENERVTPNGDTLLKISKALNTPLDEFFLEFSLFKNI